MTDETQKDIFGAEIKTDAQHEDDVFETALTGIVNQLGEEAADPFVKAFRTIRAPNPESLGEQASRKSEEALDALFDGDSIKGKQLMQDSRRLREAGVEQQRNRRPY